MLNNNNYEKLLKFCMDYSQGYYAPGWMPGNLVKTRENPNDGKIAKQ